MRLTEEQEMFRRTVRDFARKEVAPLAVKIDEEGAFPPETFRKMAAVGLTGIPYPEEEGGGGADAVSYIIAIEELAKVCASTSLTLAAHISLGSYPIHAFGTAEQKQKYLTPLARGEHLGAFGLTEPNAGSDASATETTAVRKGDSYIINGSKMFMTNASMAGTFVVTASTDRSKGVRGIDAYIVERSSEGVRIARKEDKLGMRGSDTCLVAFEDVKIPARNRLGEEGEGFKIFMKTLDAGRISVGALSLGIAEGAYERAVAYARERRQFGKPIGSFQAVQFMIADMEVDIEATRHLIYHAARLEDEGVEFSRESAIAKLFASEAAMRVTRNAIQIHGGYGYLREYEVERMYRDAKLCEIGEGTSEVQRLVIARKVLGRL